MFEVLIVVAILAMLSGGIAIAALKAKDEADRSFATEQTQILRKIAELWWMREDAQDGECPSFEALRSSRLLDPSAHDRDPWGKPWIFECSEGEIRVSSAGKDRTPRTADDIQNPPPR